MEVIDAGEYVLHADDEVRPCNRGLALRCLDDEDAFLRQLADRLDQNEVVLRRGSDEITLSLPRNVVLELKVEEEDKKGRAQRSLEVEIEWYEGEEDAGELTLG